MLVVRVRGQRVLMVAAVPHSYNCHGDGVVSREREKSDGAVRGDGAMARRNVVVSAMDAAADAKTLCPSPTQNLRFR